MRAASLLAADGDGRAGGHQPLVLRPRAAAIELGAMAAARGLSAPIRTASSSASGSPAFPFFSANAKAAPAAERHAAQPQDAPASALLGLPSPQRTHRGALFTFSVRSDLAEGARSRPGSATPGLDCMRRHEEWPPRSLDEGSRTGLRARSASPKPVEVVLRERRLELIAQRWQRCDRRALLLGGLSQWRRNVRRMMAIWDVLHGSTESRRRCTLLRCLEGWRARGRRRQGLELRMRLVAEMRRLRVLTDGTGTPDPNPKHLVDWCFKYTLVHLTFF